MVRASALVTLSVLAVTSCKDTTINQKAGGDADACVQGSTCSEDDSSDVSDAPSAESSSGTFSSSPGERGGGGTGSAVPGEESGDDANGDVGQEEGGTGSVEGEAVPVSVELSGGNLPDGLKDSADGCVMGICTSWNSDDVVVGGKSFGTGFVIECTIACGEGEHGYFQMKLAGKYSKLDATFGIAADSPGNDKTETLKVNLVDQGTGKVLHSETLEYGRSYALRGFDVSHVGLLRVSFDGALGGAHGAVGAPVVRR
ncbi:hypothetical protein [Streptomyces sp. NBC_00151]|uniref:hypothetical protein n=1 Tax=Streptomyces sp. NBC_00151 TaxID=2975669 RepID=UPI002DDA4419|nr:hypothetical protein [Streptomyces sp. NBC_00151]WRZ39952.1 hypothetical protein OG915_19030 [Streptomyces sp. NBC_00151]